MKRLLERSEISYLILLLAIVLKIALYLHYFQLEGDKLFQALGAKNLVEGRGLTFNHVHAGALSTEIYEPVNRWPPGYSLLLSAFYFVTRDIVVSCVIMDVISVILFFIVLTKLLRSLMFPEFLISLLILFNGAAFGPYISKPTDLIANAALLFACYLAVVFLSNENKSRRFGFTLGACSVLPLFFRYMYLPCVFVIPAILLFVGYFKKDSRVRQGGVNSLIMSLALAGGILMFQKIFTGNASYVFLSGSGLYWENLLMLYPSVIAAFVDINFVQLQVSLLTGIPYIELSKALRLLNGMMLIILILAFCRFLVRKSSFLYGRWNFFLVVIGILNVVILFTLAYLSVINNAQSSFFTDRLRWTFVEDGRFFIFLTTVLPIVAGYYLFNIPDGFRYQKAGRILFVCLILFQVSHTVYFLVKRFDPLALKGGNVLMTSFAKDYLTNRMREIKQDGRDVVLSSHDETASNWAALVGERGMLNIEELRAGEIKAAKNTVMLVVIHEEMLPVYQSMMAEKKFSLEKKIDRLYIFHMLVRH